MVSKQASMTPRDTTASGMPLTERPLSGGHVHGMPTAAIDPLQTHGERAGAEPVVALVEGHRHRVAGEVIAGRRCLDPTRRRPPPTWTQTRQRSPQSRSSAMSTWSWTRQYSRRTARTLLCSGPVVGVCQGTELAATHLNPADPQSAAIGFGLALLIIVGILAAAPTGTAQLSPNARGRRRRHRADRAQRGGRHRHLDHRPRRWLGRWFGQPRQPDPPDVDHARRAAADRPPTGSVPDLGHPDIGLRTRPPLGVASGT